MRNYIAEDGREYEFDRKRFRSYFSELYNKENRGEQRKTREILRREIAEHVHVSEDAVKNWMRAKSGNNPGDLQTVYKLETFFRVFPFLNVPEGYFLKPVSVKEEDDNMNANYTALECNTCELDAAKSLYVSILNTIHAYEITFADFVDRESVRISAFRGMSKERYKLILEIKKAAMDLPENLRLSAIELVNDIYGPEDNSPYAFYETEDFQAYINSDEYQAYRKKYAEEMDPKFLKLKQGDYREFLKAECCVSLEELEGEEMPNASELGNYPNDIVDRFNYNEHKTAEFYRRLDEIFGDYIKR